MWSDQASQNGLFHQIDNLASYITKSPESRIIRALSPGEIAFRGP